ncbi:hypothetical protein DdX_05652 [Ditylenchus destructor]|uniref:Uncharacterized protein n=1 Tax=Ditylenchus destructor TaxID=166010 RepID=A0AAD4RA63_9BILA|nr:hypothetical protein DdX_05652 [Ditylenchus destructor]
MAERRSTCWPRYWCRSPQLAESCKMSYDTARTRLRRSSSDRGKIGQSRDSRASELGDVRLVGPDFGVVRLSSPRAAK